MKKLLFLGIVMLLIAPSASAQPADAYLALYEDAARTDWCVSGIGFVTMYLFVLPSVDGVVCAELNISVTGTGAALLMWGVPTFHPDVAEPVMGSIPGDMGVCFPVGVCKTDWIYFYSVGILVQTVEPARVEIGPYAAAPYPKVLDCLDAEPEAIIFNHYYINDCGPVAVDESSWGAIKSLYR